MLQIDQGENVVSRNASARNETALKDFTYKGEVFLILIRQIFLFGYKECIAFIINIVKKFFAINTFHFSIQIFSLIQTTKRLPMR